MSNYEYKGVNLKKEYMEAIDKAFEENPFINSRAEFIRRSIEFYLNYLKNNGELVNE